MNKNTEKKKSMCKLSDINRLIDMLEKSTMGKEKRRVNEMCAFMCLCVQIVFDWMKWVHNGGERLNPILQRALAVH